MKPATVASRKAPPLTLERVTLLWNLWTGLYMLQPWERLVFSAFHCYLS